MRCYGLHSKLYGSLRLSPDEGERKTVRRTLRKRERQRARLEIRTELSQFWLFAEFERLLPQLARPQKHNGTKVAPWFGHTWLAEIVSESEFDTEVNGILQDYDIDFEWGDYATDKKLRSKRSSDYWPDYGDFDWGEYWPEDDDYDWAKEYIERGKEKYLQHLDAENDGFCRVCADLHRVCVHKNDEDKPVQGNIWKRRALQRRLP